MRVLPFQILKLPKQMSFHQAGIPVCCREASSEAQMLMTHHTLSFEGWGNNGSPQVESGTHGFIKHFGIVPGEIYDLKREKNNFKATHSIELPSC